MQSFSSWAKNIIFLLVYILSGVVLVIIIDGVATGNELSPLNNAVESLVEPIRTPFLTEFMLYVTNFGSPLILSTVAIFLAIILTLHRETYDALLYIVSIMISVITLSILKNTFEITRPLEGLISVGGWSFPSGHATVATAFFFVTAYSFFDWPKRVSGKALLVALCIFSATLVSFSRLYLAAHFALDVLAGIALGLLSVSFTALIFNVFLEERGFRGRMRALW